MIDEDENLLGCKCPKKKKKKRYYLAVDEQRDLWLVISHGCGSSSEASM